MIKTCGDFNLVLDPNKDIYNYLKINNPNARKSVIEIVNDLDLIDIYRYLHPHVKLFFCKGRADVCLIY